MEYLTPTYSTLVFLFHTCLAKILNFSREFYEDFIDKHTSSTEIDDVTKLVMYGIFNTNL